MQRKRGKFSIEELAYIDSNMSILSVAQMAIELKRSEDVIQKHFDEIKDSKNIVLNKASQAEAVEDLRSKPFWHDLKLQYTEKELELYQYYWAKYLEQFDYDVTASEENQICKFIDLDLMMSRVKREIYKVNKEIELIEKRLTTELNKDETLQDTNYIQATQQQLLGYRASQSSRTKEFNDLHTRHSSMARDLKTTRDQRFKDIQERKVTFHGLLKSFRDKKSRTTMSREAELVKLAMEKSKDHFSNYHTYQNGEVDQPILSSESLKEDNQ